MGVSVTILGCGASAGVPLLGCDCPVCGSDNPRNKRLRASILIECNGVRILVDASPDLRQQCLSNRITCVDALIITHAHADHCHGIDDMRSLNYHKKGPIDAYADVTTFQELEERFGYVFRPHDTTRYIWYKPWLIPHRLPEHEQAYPYVFDIGGVEVTGFIQYHGKMPSLGIRIGDFAYSTDVNAFPETSYPCLEGLDLWVVDCLRPHISPTHAHLDLTLEWLRRFKPKRAVLTHMSHDVDYAHWQSLLPEGAEPAYDGMVLESKYTL